MYSVQKTVLPAKKQRWNKLLFSFLIIVSAPFVLLTMLMIAVMNLPSRISFLRSKKREAPARSFDYALQFTLFENEKVSIILSEEEHDRDLMDKNLLWNQVVYKGDEYLYRAATFPIIPALHNKVVGNFSRQMDEGLLLQVLQEGSDPLNTRLVFLQFRTLECYSIGEIGQYQLYADINAGSLIKGVNQHERVEIAIVKNNE